MERVSIMNRGLGRPIAYGRTAEVYVWYQGYVLKLFYKWYELDKIEYEARISRAIHASGLSAPAVGDIVRVNDRYGLIYQRVYGVSMFEMFQRKPWKFFHFAWRMAELQTEIHTSTIQADLPSQRNKLERNIHQAEALPDQLKLRVLSALENMPDGEQLCHGDFWPGNILMTIEGEIIIDWFHASRGNPHADLARTTNLVLGFTKTSQIRRPFLSFNSTETNSFKNSLLQIYCRICYPAYINYYFKICPGDKDEYKRWLPIIAAARLSDNIPELEEMLIEQVERHL